MASGRAVKHVDVDAGLIERAREAMQPAVDTADAEVVERALRLYIGRHALEASQAISELTEEQALQLANEELHAMRRQRRQAA